LQRGGPVHAVVVSDVNGERIREHIRRHVTRGSKLSTDSNPIYKALGEEYDHQAVNHFAEEYVRGEVHTNSIENFWSVLKRGLHGTYINVEPFHLFRYLDEQIFRFNSRKTDNAGRFRQLLSRLAGKRLTYAALIGGAEPQTC
jgi:transposase-like protein